MSRQIHMYNAYFGDCFVIRDYDSSLVVDFGMHVASQVSGVYYTNRHHLLATIAQDIKACNDSPSLLITHFHTDHINGLLQAYNAGTFRNYFNKIYIANIWDNPFSVASTLLEEMILYADLKATRLPSASCSLFDLIKFLCGNHTNTVLLSRGVKFEDDKFQALWPPIAADSSFYENSLRNFGFPDGLIYRLHQLAISICNFVQPVLSYRERYLAPVITERVEEFSAEYDAIYNDFEDSVNNIPEDQYISLNSLNHTKNVVFHDTVSSDDAVLFTGDAETEQLNAIACATDYPLHNHYKYIKIPHHGTNRHYFDFNSFSPSNILIPNGVVAGRGTAYHIDARYGLLSTNHTCSNSNNCDSCMYICRNLPASGQPCHGRHQTVFNNIKVVI